MKTRILTLLVSMLECEPMQCGWAEAVFLITTTSCSSSGGVGASAAPDPSSGGAITSNAAAGSGGKASGGSSGATAGGTAGSTGGGAGHGASDSGRITMEGTGGGPLSFDAGPDGDASCSGECPTRACEPSGVRCRLDELCVQQTITPPIGPGPGTTTSRCAPNLCGSAPLDCSCASSLCWGQCNYVAGYDVQCTYYAVCADPDTPIATPEGERRIADLTEGDLVYTIDRGAIVLAPIARTSRTAVKHHSVMRVVFESGSVLAISPGHPTADGRLFGELRVGDSLDGVVVRSVGLVSYAHDATYDILPASDSGSYFAGGVLVGSTLSRNATRVTTPTAPLATSESLSARRAGVYGPALPCSARNCGAPQGPASGNGVSSSLAE